MTKTLKTGLQFLGTSAGFLLLAALCAWPFEGNIKPVGLNHHQAVLYYGSALPGFLAAATGLMAAIYFASSAIEGLGHLLWSKKQKKRDGKLVA